MTKPLYPTETQKETDLPNGSTLTTQDAITIFGQATLNARTQNGLT